MYVNVVICNILMGFFLMKSNSKFFYLLQMKEKSKEIQTNITQSEVCSGIPLFIEHIPLKRCFPYLLLRTMTL